MESNKDNNEVNNSQDDTTTAEEKKEMTSSDYYWNSYAHFAIHEEMLKDSVRTLSYRKAILENTHLFTGKVVLDVGCGTGILSMFAAQAGAAKVFAVDSSDIIDQAQQIIKDNKLDGVITCFKGMMEKIELPEKVDIIISEWMGYFLLYETMLPTVLDARDKWMKEGGMLFPDKANIYVAAIEDADYKNDKIDYWNNVYGFNFSCIKEIAYKEPLVDTVEGNAVATTPCKILSLDLNTITKEDLTFTTKFEIFGQRNDYVHALIAWFDITFSTCHKPVYFTTSPSSKYTHWKQTVFYLQDTLSICVGDRIHGSLSCKPNGNNPRDLDISISYAFKGKYQDIKKEHHYVLR
jgi:protein arginine N-methyltransferase 1